MALVETLPVYPTAKITGLQFSVPDRASIRRAAVVPVTSVSIYSKGVPVDRSVNDLRMGTTDRRMRCTTCWNQVNTCTGHAGYFQLPTLMYHGAYIDATMKILRTICYQCARPRCELPARSPLVPAKQHFLNCYAKCKQKKACCHCECELPSFSKSGNVINAKWPGGQPPDDLPGFSLEYAHHLLGAISEDDWHALGFNGWCDAQSLVTDRMFVAPPPLRPSIVNDSRSRGQDDLTHCLQDINRQINMIRKAMPRVAPDDRAIAQLLDDIEAAEVPKEAREKLQNSICALCNNQRAENRATQRSGNPLKTLKDRLVGKEGLVRGNMLGKRTNHSARSVISPDPRLDIDEIGMPLVMATSLTIPVRVQRSNLADLTEAVRLGANTPGGAAMIVTRDGVEVDLLHCALRDQISLRPDGDVVHRYLRDGDPVLFNRQPSLHVGSMMCHKVKIVHDTAKETIETLRLNPITAGPYNADFDGDEMNVHVPQSVATIVEMEALMRVTDQIVSPQGNKPIMGLVQDSLTGIYMLSAPSTKLRRYQLLQILGAAKYFGGEGRLPGIPDATGTDEGGEWWDGNSAISCVLPPINLSNARVEIKDGVVLRGRFDKGIVGKSSGGVIQRIQADFGNKAVAEFMSDIQNVVDEFVMCFFGLSCGISDCIPTEEARTGAVDVVDRSLDHMQKINELVGRAATIDDTDKENAVLRIASNVLSGCGQSVMASMNDTNNIFRMVNSGAKGNSINITQIMGAVSQSCVDGHRILPSRQEGRNFPSMQPGDDSPTSLGFVRSSYHRGLNPQEFFFHMMGGREGLVDTAVKTSVTGYLQRRLTKFTENLTIANALRRGLTGCTIVMNALDTVCSFSYGADGYDPRKLQRVSAVRALAPGAADGMSADEAAAYRSLQQEFTATFCRVGRLRKLDTDFHLPVDASVLLLYFRSNGGRTITKACWQRSMTALCARVTDLLARDASLTLIVHLRYALRFAAVKQARLTALGMDEISDIVCSKVQYAMAPAGMMAGCLCGQSVGEPLTQMNLNSFHLCLGKTTGVSRVKEIIDATRNMKAPCVTCVPVAHCPPDTLRRVAAMAPSQMLEDITASHAPVERRADDADELARALHGPGISDAPGVRLSLNRKHMEARHLSIVDVTKALTAYVGPTFWVLGSSSLTDDWSVRLLLRPEFVPKEDVDGCLADLMQHLLPKVQVGGIAAVDASATRDVVHTDPQTMERCTTTVIDMSGTALLPLFSSEFFVHERLYSNSIMEVYDTLGIEAANACLFQELNDCLTDDGTYINLRHLSTVADSMTIDGITSVSRHGVNQFSAQPLHRCSFEETWEVATDAALFGYKDDMTGVSASMMFGQESPIGTGYNELLFRPSVETLTRKEVESWMQHGCRKRERPLAQPEGARGTENPFAINEAAFNQSCSFTPATFTAPAEAPGDEGGARRRARGVRRARARGGGRGREDHAHGTGARDGGGGASKGGVSMGDDSGADGAAADAVRRTTGVHE